KVDRTSMNVGLEARVPLLDHRIVEWSLSLPTSLKIRDGKSKWLLRQVLDRHLPADIWSRRKRGFTVPVGAWLRGPLRAWAEDLLSVDRLSRDGFFQVDPVRKAWQSHLQGGSDSGAWIWDLLMFQSWLDAR
ncbi:MAG: asparagine synthase-related protein, partial [Planctomycetota bacterium]|nr:asparagine synthase-related protein [Planctomycetota bacterium]